VPYTCLYEGVFCVGILSCGDDAINRTMVWVVATVIRVSRDACRANSLLCCFRAYFSYCQGLG
jgi:hypothetical protein